MLVIQVMAEFPHSKDYGVVGETQNKSIKGHVTSDWYGCQLIRLSHKGSCFGVVGKGLWERKLFS